MEKQRERKLPIRYSEAFWISIALEYYSEEMWNRYIETEDKTILDRYAKLRELGAHINDFLMKCEKDFGLHEGVGL